MTESNLLDALTGSGETVPGFPDLDQRFQLKLRAYTDTAMPAVFRDLQKVMSISAMRRDGIYPIMYYLQFRPEPVPLVFGRPVRADYEARLRRYRPAPDHPTPGAPNGDRLMLDVTFDIMGLRGSGKPEEMGGARGEPDAKAGWGRIVQVITRPFAAAGERQVTELPEAYRKFREHPWEQAYPAWELLARVPHFFQQKPVEIPFHESVWSFVNTDVNQHVNIVEYVAAIENHHTRLLAAAGIDPRKHRVTVTEQVFRAPFFAGETYRVWGQLFKKGDAILCLAGVYKGDTSPALDARPGMFTRIEGWLERDRGGTGPAH
jgi:hypothetical protein